MKLEWQIKKEIQSYLKTLEKCKAFSYNPYYGEAGIPDIVVCYHGRFIGIEVKTEKGRVTKLQEQRHKELREAGGKVFVVKSVDEIKNNLI